MSTAPIVEFYDESGTNKITSWNIGEIDADSESSVFKTTLWNNKGGSTDVSSMKRIKLNVVNPLGGDTDLEWDTLTGALAVDSQSNNIQLANGPVSMNWINARINYAGSDDSEGWTAIGGKASVDVQAAGISNEYSISGKANSGSVSADIDNYAKIDFKAVVPLNAPAGEIHFKERVTYFYT
jgi:hypothetical protein